MSYDVEILRRIYDRTEGHCHICGKKLSFANYAISSGRGAWEVEHSVAKATGGTNHLNNLFPACITCNRSKRSCQ
jgi:5-methylcytosine-specific restriction endonuclease McrA